MKNPVILHLMSRDYTFSDLEYNTSDIAYYYILPARELKENKCFSLARFSIDFLY